MMSAPAIYDNLKLEEGEIRLLSIDEGTGPELSGRLTKFKIDRKPGILGWLRGWLRDFWNPYEALSYHWGDQERKQTICCNDETLEIQSNLYDALAVLRQVRPGVPIWADALCINQSDENEKRNQIKIMGRIYSTARHVWAFIGDAPDGMDKLMNCIPKIYRAYRKMEESVQSMQPENWHKLPQGLHSDSSLPPSDSPVWHTLLNVLDKEYFARLWILQEVALARKVDILCGTYRLSWTQMETLFHVADRFQAIQQYRAPGFFHNKSAFLTTSLIRPHGSGNLSLMFFQYRRTFMAYLMIWFEKHKDKLADTGLYEFALDAYKTLASSDLEKLLEYSKGQVCSRPEDKVLAITGMLQASVGQQELPWLSKVSTEDIYLEAFYFLAHNDMSFTMLRMAPSDPANGLSLPSWCPDFHHIRGHALDEQGFSGRILQDWQASKRRQRVRRDGDIRRLSLVGIRVSTICFVSERWETLDFSNKAQDANELQRRISANQRWLKIDLYSVLELHSTRGEAQTHAALKNFWRTIILERTVNVGTHEMTVNDFLRLYEFLERATSPTSSYVEECERIRAEEQEAASSKRPGTIDTLRRLNFELRDKVFFLTENGQFGLAFPGVCAGDTLVVLQGAKVPHLLRRQEDSNTWTFVGETYVHDLMHGEAENAVDGKAPGSEMFVLV